MSELARLRAEYDHLTHSAPLTRFTYLVKAPGQLLATSGRYETAAEARTAGLAAAEAKGIRPETITALEAIRAA